MKLHQHKIKTEDMSITEKLFFENEVKTNRLIFVSLIVVTFMTAVFGIPLSLDVLGTNYTWTGWMLNACCLLEIINMLLIRRIGYDDYRTKYLVIGGVLTIGGVTYFVFPLSTIFLFCCPVLLSVKYYDEKLSLRNSIATWLVFALASSLNMILDKVSVGVHNLHVEQGMVLWSDVSYTMHYYILVRTMVLTFEAFFACHIARAGRKMVMEQAEYYSNAANMTADLNTASKIQNSMLPESEFVSPNDRVVLSAKVRTAKDVGGDFYDYFMINEHLMVVLVADVSDKGLPAAMYAMEAQSLLHFAFYENLHYDAYVGIEGIKLEETINVINSQLTFNNLAEMFVTMWIGVIDTRNGRGKYVNAGHNFPYIIHADGTPFVIENAPQFFMGIFDGTEFRSQNFRLQDGDFLVLYTDGATDARNDSDETYGEEKFKKLLSNTIKREGWRKPADLKDKIFMELDGYMGDSKQYDDITIMTLSYNE